MAQQLTVTPGTRYQEGAVAGRQAGMRADLGSSTLGNSKKELS
jgi:hypothetical protein